MKLLIFPIVILFSFPLFAQNLPQTDTQWWNDITITKPIVKAKDKKGKEFDKISIFFNGGLRIGNNVKTLIDERIGFGFDFKVYQFLTLSPSYFYRHNKPKLNSREYESRFRFSATLEKKWTKFSLKDRNLVEYQLKNSKADAVRYRNRITLTIPILKDKKELFAPFVVDEVFYDFKARQWTRNEFSVGISRKFTNNFSADFFYLRRDNRSGIPKSLNVIGIALKFKID